MRVVNLASGSKGNVTFFEAGGVKLLIDTGLSLRELEMRLSQIGENLQNINAILITHEHSDHIKSLIAIMKKYNVRAYVHERVVKEYLKLNEGELYDRISQISTYEFGIGDLRITPFSLPHDSLNCLGYTIEYKTKKVAFVTDLGFMPQNVLSLLFGSSLVFIESNHDRHMLLSNYYPRIVKERILSDKGHLSNEQAAAVIVALAKRGTKHFSLAHISEHSNTIELAFSAAASALENAGFVLEKDVFVRYCRQDKCSNNYIFGEDDGN